MSLISPEALLDRLGDPGLRICDVRWFLADPAKGRRDYDTGHLPGAVFVDLDRDLAAPPGAGRHPLPSPEDFVERMEALGIGQEHEVVAYDDAGGTVAARLWWMLDALGHPAVRVLDGGLQVWIAAGGPLSTEVTSFPRARLELRASWPRTVHREALRAGAGVGSVIDARAPERYRGDVEPVDLVAGHIPGAISRPTSANLGPDGRFLGPGALRARFEGLAAPVVTTCGSGVNACHNALAMRIAGLPDPLLYPGSYSDWTRAGLPVATGDSPGG